MERPVVLYLEKINTAHFAELELARSMELV